MPKICPIEKLTGGVFERERERELSALKRIIEYSEKDRMQSSEEDRMQQNQEDIMQYSEEDLMHKRE